MSGPRPLAAAPFPLHVNYPLEMEASRTALSLSFCVNSSSGLCRKVNNHGFEAWSSLVQHAAAKTR